MKYLFALFIIIYSTATFAADPKIAVGEVLDNLHEAASKAQGERYFSLFSEDATFIGTDVTEVWDMAAFKAFATPYFSKGKGWTYTPTQRHIYLSQDMKTAWFDEVLQNEKLGVTRGTGVLLQINDEWKIAQYHLAIPVPNALAGEVSATIKAHRAKQKN